MYLFIYVLTQQHNDPLRIQHGYTRT